MRRLFSFHRGFVQSQLLFGDHRKVPASGRFVSFVTASFLPATPTLKATTKPSKGSSAPRARKPCPQSSALRLCRPPLRSALSHSRSAPCKGGDTPSACSCYPRLRQVAFGMYVACHLPPTTAKAKEQRP